MNIVERILCTDCAMTERTVYKNGEQLVFKILLKLSFQGIAMQIKT